MVNMLRTLALTSALMIAPSVGSCAPSPTLPAGGVSLDRSFCPAGQPFPLTYQVAESRDPTGCRWYDPCSVDGKTTLWLAQPCELWKPPTR